MVSIAVDIGGTKIATGIVLDDKPKEVLFRSVRPTLAQEGGQVVLREVIAAIQESRELAKEAGLEPKRIGIGAPGVVGNGRILYAGPTMPGWVGTELTERITEKFQLPIALHNDVRVMGLGEAVYGIGADKEVLFVSIGTGIGGALISRGELIDSPHFNRGEIAYLLGPTPQGGCAPIEHVGSGPAMSQAYGTDSLHPVMQDYRAGVKEARALIDKSQECVGQAIAGFINSYDVDAVVLGGGVGTLPETLAPFEKGLRSGLISSLKDIPCIQATLGTNAPLVGAAYLARTKDNT
ncbi:MULTISPECIES: ROK family protein [unclassified Corynebacterium]|uniref:ROK family protein n=1 Tax=unclassified Corynebacterium TaxID=2624378 RepID=UPI002168E093|nr:MULTISPECIES: ROK family protein [unclassified Corynebacterium]MCS4491647.1 ROK family protein [Corynebacterium sp. ES2715-CONJ3]MCS4531752.1 ROK family protein [Corynebacterium sp. ES2730-CONJ]